MKRESVKPEVRSVAKNVVSPGKAVVSDRTENNADKTADISVDIDINIDRKRDTNGLNLQISQQKLREAIIWSELLGKPVCKRRKRVPHK